MNRRFLGRMAASLGAALWLACSLPAQLPSNANLAREPEARRLATGDYAFVREALGPCERRITAG